MSSRWHVYFLNDWDAVVAFVKNPGLPATNNEAERALRWVVLFRKITYGTRTVESSRSFAAMLSVIETCRLRDVDPWEYIANVIAHASYSGESQPQKKRLLSAAYYFEVDFPQNNYKDDRSLNSFKRDTSSLPSFISIIHRC